MSDNIVVFPGQKIPRQRAKVIAIRSAASVPDAQRDENLQIVRRDFEHALRKLGVVAEYHGELPWAVRLLENALNDFKSRAESK